MHLKFIYSVRIDQVSPRTQFDDHRFYMKHIKANTHTPDLCRLRSLNKRFIIVISNQSAVWNKGIIQTKKRPEMFLILITHWRNTLLSKSPRKICSYTVCFYIYLSQELCSGEETQHTEEVLHVNATVVWWLCCGIIQVHASTRKKKSFSTQHSVYL